MSRESPTVLLLGQPGRPLAVLQEILRSARLDVWAANRPAQALQDMARGAATADLLVIDEAIYDHVAAHVPTASSASAAPRPWPSTVVLTSTADQPVERLAPWFARLRKPVEPSRLLRELHAGLPATADVPRFDVRHAGLVLLVGERLCEDADWYEALELTGLEATTVANVPAACDLCQQFRFDLVVVDAHPAAESESAALAMLLFRRSFGFAQPMAALLAEPDDEPMLRPQLEALGVELVLTRTAAIEESLAAIGTFLDRLDRARPV